MLVDCGLGAEKVTCWDSLSTFSKGKIVNSKKGRGNLCRFLQYFTNDKEDTWKGKIDLENSPRCVPSAGSGDKTASIWDKVAQCSKLDGLLYGRST